MEILRQIERERISSEYEDSDSNLDSDTDEEEIDSSDSSDEEKKNESHSNTEEWKSKAKRIHPPSCSLSPFLSRSALQCSSPLEFFRLFLTLELMDHIVKATNTYGSTIFKEKWTNSNEKEMDCLISAVIYMGIHRSPTLQSYWADDSKSPFISHLFPSRDRFLQLY
jgi:hypothetical protein